MERNIMWIPWAGPGLEHLHLLQNGGNIAADSIIIGIKDRTTFRLWYEMVCDASGFSAELAVDGDGLVMDYPGVFRRVWP